MNVTQSVWVMMRKIAHADRGNAAWFRRPRDVARYRRYAACCTRSGDVSVAKRRRQSPVGRYADLAFSIFDAGASFGHATTALFRAASVDRRESAVLGRSRGAGRGDSRRRLRTGLAVLADRRDVDIRIRI